MPYARPGRTRPLPRRPPPVRVPRRAAHAVGPAGSTLAAQLGGWNFAARVYVAWDAQSAAYPAWIEVTQYCDLEDSGGIVITRGRPDSESDPQVATCTLTVDNSDGRWSPANPAGAWYGQIRKGAWLRVDVLPLSGVVSRRFTGFIQQLPVTWSGQYSQVQISASDRMVLLGNAPKYQSAIAEEWLNDPVGSPYIVGYWPLHEPQGATYVSDVSGKAPPTQSTLSVYNQNVNPGTGITFGSTSGPGNDGTSTVSFAPSGTQESVLDPGAYPQGSYLQGQIGPCGNVALVSCWINTTLAAFQPIWSWTDPASNYGLWCGILGGQIGGGQPDPLVIGQYPLNGVTTAIGIEGSINFGYGNICDGTWHQITVMFQTPAALNGTAFAGDGAMLFVFIDGAYNFSYFTGTNQATTTVPIPTLTRFTLGGAESWQLFGLDPLPGQVSLFTGSISDLVIETLPNTPFVAFPSQFPDWFGAAQAGSQMWQSPNAAYPVPESCGRRILRLAQYAGITVPTASFELPSNSGIGFDVATGTNPFVNIPAETAHPAGFQQLVGQGPLDCMHTAAHTENMPLFVDKAGRITLQASTLRQNPAVAFTINAADLDPGTQWADDFQYLTNQTVVTPSGQGSLTVNTNGLASQALLGVYSGSVDSITTNPLESGSLGAAINAAGADPAPRHNPLQCEVATLATQSGIITQNPYFTATTAPWSPTGGTLALSTNPAFPGAPTSALLTPDGVSSQNFIESNHAAIVQGQPYTVAGYLYAATGHTVAVAVNWYTAAGSYISTTSGSVTGIGTASWTLVSMSVPAASVPGTAAFGTAVAVQGGTPPSSALLGFYGLGLIDPTSAYGAAWYDAVLAAEISSVIQVVNWPRQSASGPSGAYYNEGYTETISGGNHLFAWNTSPVQGATYQLDSPTLGLLDTPGLTLAY